MDLFRKYLVLLVWVFYLTVAPLILFLRGFLLNRRVLPLEGECERLPPPTCPHPAHLPDPRLLLHDPDASLDHLCHSPPREGFRVVLLIVDALRYDFIAPPHALPLGQEVPPYRNKLPVVERLLRQGKGRLYKFMADPPTTTHQRLNALTTGSLPTFIDIGANFATSEIYEDNLIDQLIGKNGSIVMMGDDTWTKLYPRRFLRSYPFPSFNVWDLDTVDSGVWDHLPRELRETDWHLLIAHFLGVDHCGHRYGLHHPEMSRKLTEMNSVIEEVVEALDNRTLLVVMGDHGMTPSGDHGGDSDDELTAGLFLFSKDADLVSKLSPVERVKQIDLVPTLATLLGIPIPFSNLGAMLLNVEWSSAHPDDCPGWKYDLLRLLSNVDQVTRYLREYSKENKELSPDSLDQLMVEYKLLKRDVGRVSSEESLAQLVSRCHKYLFTVREMCEGVWVSFDSLSMSRGLVLMALSLGLLFIVVDGVPGVRLKELLDGDLLMYIICFIIISTCTAFCLWCYKIVHSLELSIYFFTCTTSLMILSFIIVTNWHLVAESWFKKNQSKSFLDIASRVFVVLSTCGLFSNSYIVNESGVIYFLALSLLWLVVASVKGEGKSPYFNLRGQLLMAGLVLSALLRFSFVHWQCREENYVNCSYAKMSVTSVDAVSYVIAFGLFVYLSRSFLKRLGNLVSPSFNILLSQWGPLICVMAGGCYWLLASLPHHIKSKLFLPWHLELFPRTVLAVTLFSLVVIYTQPLSVFSLTSLHPNPSNTIPSLFNKLKTFMVDRPPPDDEIPVVFGLATVYSAAFVNMAVPLCFLGAVLLGESKALSALIMVASMSGTVLISSVVKHSKASRKEELFKVPWWAILLWSLSALYFFYGTGHQATFPSIDWNVVSLFGNVVSTLAPGLLVLSATFISHIAHALLIPALILGPFTLNVLWPKLAPQKLGMSKGEVMLLEMEGVRRQEMFSLVVKYTLFLGLRVFMSMLSASIHSRHLMVWKIFTPKLIFEAVGLVVSLPFLTLSFLLVERISCRAERFISECVMSKRLNL